jgi:NADPH2:quinone reductase
VKALLCREYGHLQNLVVEDVASPKADSGQVCISVKACGINFADLLMVGGRYQVRPPLPFSPGFEFSGIVSEVGDDVADFTVGQRVVAASFFGGMAESACVPSDRVLPLPDTIDFAPAAAFLIAYGTAWHALRDRAALRADETLVVLGAAGGVGLAAVEVGKRMQATVIAAASSDEKLELARQYGADHRVNYAESDLRDSINEITSGRGADVIYDPVGGELFEQCLRAVAWGGRILVIGFASGQIPTISANLPLLKGMSIVGVYYGRFIDEQPERNAKNVADLFGLLETGSLSPHISETYPLDRAREAFEALADRRATGRIIIEI